MSVCPYRFQSNGKFMKPLLKRQQRLLSLSRSSRKLFLAPGVCAVRARDPPFWQRPGSLVARGVHACREIPAFAGMTLGGDD